MAKRTWTTTAREVVFRTDPDSGALFASVPLNRDGVRMLTVELRVDEEGEVDLRVLRGSAEAVLQGFTARSDF